MGGWGGAEMMVGWGFLLLLQLRDFERTSLEVLRHACGGREEGAETMVG